MTAAQILATTGVTKTWKMQCLFALGHTRREVATMMNVGYGFAQNVYAAWVTTRATAALATPVPTPAAATWATFTPRTVARNFGVEIEAFGPTRTALLGELEAQGIEAQGEGYNHTTRPHWKIVSDASVSGQNAFELVSPVLNGCDGLEDVRRACRALNTTNANVNDSCGLHVHIDARDLTLEHLRRICLNYLRLERTIDQLMPSSRRANNNTYCRSIQGGRTLTATEEAIRAATTTQALATAINGTSRYYKVNLQAFFRHGTIEFRQHSGSTNADKVIFWVRFLLNLVEYSRQHEVPATNSVTDFANFNQRDIATYYTRRRTALQTR
ncbi:amidoligase family protein [Hymenobacter pini]|uniref:amidoligase family protein n=1 Tax=Hymenobacter pini TaxID=2880879 RepID=UPI001CF2C006|nr:amidoligase family protein [Hymenobacter pini]MCA8830524.1 amidoligase family protein [Hymenobacter pini]